MRARSSFRSPKRSLALRARSSQRSRYSFSAVFGKGSRTSQKRRMKASRW